MDSPEIDERLARARAGTPGALSELLALYQERLERMVALRMDRARHPHFDPQDVVQDALVEATRRFGEWCAQDRYPFHVWLRLLTAQALAAAQRSARTQKRDIARDRPFDVERSGVNAPAAAEWLVSTHTTPTQAARRVEVRELVTAALEQLDELDRETLALRFFEQLSNEEAAAELGIDPATARKRLSRALQRMRPALRALESSEGGLR